MLVANKEMATPKSSLHVFLQRSFKDGLFFNQKDWGISLNASVHSRNLIYQTWFATDDDGDSIKMVKEHLHYIVDLDWISFLWLPQGWMYDFRKKSLSDIKVHIQTQLSLFQTTRFLFLPFLSYSFPLARAATYLWVTLNL